MIPTRSKPRSKEAQEQDRPTLIACRPRSASARRNKQGSEATHGSPLGAAEIEATRKTSTGPIPRSRCPPNASPPGAPPAPARAERSRGLGGASSQRIAKRDAFASAQRRARSPTSFRSAGWPPTRPTLIETKPTVATRKSSEMALGVDQRRDPDRARRLGRPHAFQSHAHQGHRLDRARRFLRALHPLRHPRIRHERGDERHRAARRVHSLRRHVPRLLRLCARRDPPLGADGHPRHLCADPRFDRRRRGRADAPAGRASRGAARDAEPHRVPPVRRGRDRRMLGARARPRRSTLRRSRCRGRTCRRLRTSCGRQPERRAAPMSSARPTARAI